MRPVTFGVIGCGYVADFYAQCMRARVSGGRIGAAYDINPDRSRSFAQAYGGVACDSLDGLLARTDIDAVLNLTPPAAHAAITESALRSGRHVFTEKPLAGDLTAAAGLVELARRRGLALGAAPAVHRSAAGRRMRRLLRSGAVGRLSHVYCDIDDGPLHDMKPHEWLSPRDVPWPITDEFATGPVIHHAPYAVAWATMFAGTITAIQGHTAVTVPNKCGIAAGPDLCLAILTHETGCRTRLTIGALARRRRDLVVVGTAGELHLPDMWRVDGPVLRDGHEVLRPGSTWPFDTTHRINFDQGVGDLARCLSRGSTRAARLFTDTYGQLALHTQEVLDVVGTEGSYDHRLTTSLDARSAA